MRWKGQDFWSRLLLGALLLSGGQVAGAETSISNDRIVHELQTLASHAELVFVGQIVSVERRPGAVEVTFRVEQGISGQFGARYVMREWAGLWPLGHMRYIPGQRVLAFVHGASGAGLSSPVHGAEGLVPVVVQGANAPALLDIRRIAASVVRAQNTPLPTESDGAIPLAEALSFLQRPGALRNAAIARLPVPMHAHPPAAMDPACGSGVSGWQRAGDPKATHLLTSSSRGCTHDAR